MNRLHFAFGIFCLLGLTTLYSCSSQDDVLDCIEQQENLNQPHTCKLILHASIDGFKGEPQTRSAAGWENGDKLYLVFTVGESSTYGDAQYNGGSWTVNYYGSLTEGAATKCTAVYFDNPEYESGSMVKLSEGTGIYEDANGVYSYSGGTLTVTANLKPKTGRMRFSGTNNDSITVYGITHYTSYDCSNGKFTNSMGALKAKVASGYTPYIYGEFSDAEAPRINIITSNAGYTRMPSSSMFKAGESGYMSIPTEASHNGWQNSVRLKVKGVEFVMIPVVKDDSFYLMAETETTQELYGVVTGTSASKPQYPCTLSSDNWSIFVSKLSSLTEMNFTIPTRSEWLYAAQGGSKSQGYTYSGSNLLANVAWYSGNSDGNAHPVKQLQPNELGFYDMSGNVSELLDASGNSTSAYYDYTGGSYESDENGCRFSTSGYQRGYVGSVGLRVVLHI